MQHTFWLSPQRNLLQTVPVQNAAGDFGWAKVGPKTPYCPGGKAQRTWGAQRVRGRCQAPQWPQGSLRTSNCQLKHCHPPHRKTLEAQQLKVLIIFNLCISLPSFLPCFFFLISNDELLNRSAGERLRLELGRLHAECDAVGETFEDEMRASDGPPKCEKSGSQLGKMVTSVKTLGDEVDLAQHIIKI